MPPTNKTSIGAAGGKDPAEWLMGTLVPRLRKHFETHGTETHRGVYTLRVSMSDLLRDTLNAKGSGPRILDLLTHPQIRILTRLDYGNKGRNAYPPLWAMNMNAQPTRAKVRETLAAIADARTETRRRRRMEQAKEARLAGEYATTTTGGPVSTSKASDDHGPEHGHTAEMDHRHGMKTGPHHHTPVGIEWIQYRHHTHPAKTPADPLIRQPDPTPAPSTTAHLEVDDTLTGRPALVVSPERDGRYRDLLDRLYERDATIRNLTARLERAETELAECQRLLETATDPTAEEADAYLAEHPK